MRVAVVSADRHQTPREARGVDAARGIASASGAVARARDRRSVALALAGALALAACGRDDPLSDQALTNGTYLTDATPEGTVTLGGGVADLPAGSDLERIEFVSATRGDLDGDGETDAAVVLADVGTNSRILRLHAVLRHDDGVADVASRMLGDGVAINVISIADDIIAVGMRIHERGQPPLTEPTVPVVLQFALTDRGIIPVSIPAVAEEGDVQPTGDPPDLFSHRWTLTALEWGGATRDGAEGRMTPSLAFMPEADFLGEQTGRIAGAAGCNRLFADFETGDGSTLRIRAIATTRRQCRRRAQELEAAFVEALRAVRSYEVSAEELILEFGEGVEGRIRFEAGGVLLPTPGPEPAPAARTARAGYSASRARWCSANAAPCGSVHCATRSPPGTSIGPFSTFPPPSRTASTTAFTSSTMV